MSVRISDFAAIRRTRLRSLVMLQGHPILQSRPAPKHHPLLRLVGVAAGRALLPKALTLLLFMSFPQHHYPRL